MIYQQDIKNVVYAAKLAGYEVKEEDLKLEKWSAGIKTHPPRKLPKGYSAVYIFMYRDKYLKVGKASKNSKPRFQSQHYNPESSRSNLSKSLLGDDKMSQLIGQTTPGEWVRENTTRFNLLIPSELGKNFVNF